MMRLMRLTMLGAVAAALVLSVSACGSSKKSSSPATTPAATPTATTPAPTPPATTPAATTPATTPAPTATTPTDTTGSSSSGGTQGIPKNCLQFAGAAQKLGQALSGISSGTADSSTVKAYFDALASKAPSDIRASFQTLADAFGKYLDAVKGLNLKQGQTPSAGDLAKIQQAAAALQTSGVQAASAKIEAWEKAGCHS